jgi:hypothetical protein
MRFGCHAALHFVASDEICSQLACHIRVSRVAIGLGPAGCNCGVFVDWPSRLGVSATVLAAELLCGDGGLQRGHSNVLKPLIIVMV